MKVFSKDMFLNRVYILFGIYIFAIVGVLGAQAQSADVPAVPDKWVPTELNMSSSAVFDIMGISPAQIARSSDIKDFKVDWSFKSWRLNPNLSLQGQPVWELFYSRKNINKYVNSPAVMQKLSSLELSMGTVQDEAGNRRIGFGGRVNILRSNDPLLKRGFFDSTMSVYADELRLNREARATIKASIDTAKDVAAYKELSSKLIDADNQYNLIISRQRDEVMAKARVFSELYWNSSFLDLGGGCVFTYETDSVGSLKKLKVNKKTGNALWLSGGVGLGRRWLITGMFRSLQYDEKIDFVMRDTVTLDETPGDTTIHQVLFTYGINIRYGSPYINFFMEYFSDLRNIADKATVIKGGNAMEQLPSTVVIDVKTITWNVQPVHSLTIGGDWRVSRNLALNFGMRMEFDAKWKKQTFTPISTISCLMR